MEPPYTFPNLDIHPVWPCSPEEYQRAMSQVTPEGFEPVGLQGAYDARCGIRPHPDTHRLTPQGCVQVALLQLPLFQTPQPDAVWDLRLDRLMNSHVKPVPCQNRPALLQSLATRLLRYEESCTLWIQRAGDFTPTMQDHVEKLAFAQAVYTTLYRRRQLPTAPVKPPQIAAALQVLRAITDAVTPNLYRYGMADVLADYRVTLVQQLHTAFVRYGPARYPQVARSRALAHILKALRIEDGEEPRIAARVKKQLQRSTAAS